MSKILIIGGAGFLGRACLNELLGHHAVTVVGKQPAQNFFQDARLTYKQLDVLRREEVEFFLNQEHYTHLLYLAWPLSPPHNSLEHIDFAAATIGFISNFVGKNPFSRIICVGSIHETGAIRGIVPDNFIGTAPTTLYGICKKHVYDCMRIYNKEFSLTSPFCWVRLSNVYGPHDHPHKLMTACIRGIREGCPLVLKNPNRAVDFIHVRDAARGICLALLSGYEGVINIGSGKGYCLNEIEAYIASVITGSQSNPIKAFHQGEGGLVLSTENAFKILNYKEGITIEEGIKECIESN